MVTKEKDEMKRIVLATLIVVTAVAVNAESSPPLIQTGNCGGIRGGCQGYEIRSNGTILRTKSGPGTKNIKIEICINKKATEQLFEKLEEMNFTNIKKNETDNITAYIALEAEGSKHQVTWWRKDESTKILNDFMEEELQLLRAINCTGETR